MYFIFALIFLSTQTAGEPAGIMKSKAEFETKAACEIALKSDEVKAHKKKLTEAFAELGKAKNVKFVIKFECKKEEKKDDGSI